MSSTERSPGRPVSHSSTLSQHGNAHRLSALPLAIAPQARPRRPCQLRTPHPSASPARNHAGSWSLQPFCIHKMISSHDLASQRAGHLQSTARKVASSNKSSQGVPLHNIITPTFALENRYNYEGPHDKKVIAIFNS